MTFSAPHPDSFPTRLGERAVPRGPSAGLEQIYATGRSGSWRPSFSMLRRTGRTTEAFRTDSCGFHVGL